MKIKIEYDKSALKELVVIDIMEKFNIRGIDASMVRVEIRPAGSEGPDDFRATYSIG